MRHARIFLPLLATVALFVSLRPVEPPVNASPAAKANIVRPTTSYPETTAVAASPTADVTPRLTYATDRVMVRPRDGMSLERLARRYGVTVARAVGSAGVGALTVPAGADHQDFVAELAADVDVLTAAPEGRMYGASNPPATASWHMDQINRPAQDNTLSSIVVAVVDTGVAYENYTGGGATFVRASGFTGVTIVAPLDLVQNDGHPNDDHQHGTHIASLILSKGAIKGVAAGAALMPIKVLDNTNSGSEIDLIDAIDHAVANGADVINLALAFPLGYVPSLELQEALFAAHEAGVIVVAAAGNDGEDEICWPAASPLAIAVGSVRSNATSGTHLETYSNRGPGLDVVAPGGSMTLDHNADGWADGLAAQTIALNNPGTISWVMYQGTSQATALVSGAVVRLLKDGVAPENIPARLQEGSFSATDALSVGNGAEPLDVTAARASTAQGEAIAAGAMAFVRRFNVGGNIELEPTVRVVAVDEAGGRLTLGEVLVEIVDEDGARWESCVITSTSGGLCEVSAGRYTNPATAPDAWIYRVVGVVTGGVAHRPTRAMFSSDAGEAILSAIDTAGLSTDRSIALYWPQGTDPELGLLHESFSVTSTASYLADAPTVTNFLRSHVGPLIDHESNVTLDLEGTGILDVPLGGWGFMAKKMDLDGGGVGPLGGRLSKHLFLNGSAYASGDLGWHGAHLFAYHTGVMTPGHDELGLNGLVARLDKPVVGSPLAGTWIGGFVTDGGAIGPDGLEEAVALPAAGTLTIGHLLSSGGPSGAGELSQWMFDDEGETYEE
jgi:hypothetical protein